MGLGEVFEQIPCTSEQGAHPNFCSIFFKLVLNAMSINDQKLVIIC
jgi:hypothetical protein